MPKPPEPKDGPPFSPSLTPAFVAEALSVTLMPNQGSGSGPHNNPNSPNHPTKDPFSSVTTDSRKIRPGCLFVALKGEKFDGHEFIEKAIAQGARGVLCRRSAQPTPRKGVHIFPVEDSLDGYRKLAWAWRREFSVPIVAVAGSVGKTTTKEMLWAAMRGKWPEVLKTEGSENGFVGIPMTLLKLEAAHGAAVIEVGIDEPGAMEKHMALVGATAGVLTAIGPEHLEKLIDVPTIAREEGAALLAIAATGGLAAINLDDPWIRPHFSTLRGCRKIAFSLGKPAGAPTSTADATVFGRIDGEGKSLEVTSKAHGLRAEGFTLPLPGEHNARNLLAAIATALGLGLTAEEIREGLKSFQGALGRSEVRELPGPTPVVCDYYNASPPSMEAGLGLLAQVAREKKSRARFACLADMLELGKGEEDFHRGLAPKIAELAIENVYLCGERMRWLLSELEGRGFKGARHFKDRSELSKELIANAHPKDAVLIKGSHSMQMGDVWNALERHANKNWKK